jgi:carbamoyl-phosphate synthase small subunit
LNCFQARQLDSQGLNKIKNEIVEGSIFSSNCVRKKIKLVLDDGEIFEGTSFGFYPLSPIVGEVVFNTGMVGYTEALTDPSYCGQILCFTYPLLGNYGVPNYELDEEGLLKNFESNRIQVTAAICSSVADELTESHWESARSLSEWLSSERIPGIEMIDTRELTLHLREKGVMMGAICENAAEGLESIRASEEYSKRNFFEIVSKESPYSVGSGKAGDVVVIDCGVKINILRNIVNRGYKVRVYPYDSKYDEIIADRPDGVVLSNGPGDPKTCGAAIELAGCLMDESIPVLGICLGTQIIALSQGADTFKLKYGHRGQNKPCIDLITGKCMVTSQNHGYSVLPESLKETGLRPWFVNADDRTIEGLIHDDKPCLSVQFHPEASPGPVDASYVFDVFSEKIRKTTRNN